MPKPNHSRYRQGYKRRPQECVRNTAMLRKAGNRSAQTPQHIDIRRLRPQRHRQNSVGSLPIEAGAGKTCAGEEMSDGFHRIVSKLFL